MVEKERAQVKKHDFPKRNKNETAVKMLTKLVKVLFVDSDALKTAMTNFLLAYNIRAGVALLLRFLNVLTKKPKDIFSIKALVTESNLQFREEAVRLGLFFGGFSGIYKVISHGLANFGGKGKQSWHSAVAGWFAGVSLCAMDASWYRTLALYMSTRGIQCGYNFLKSRGHWHFWGSSWPHGDSLLFIISSAQIMYAYVMRPETLPSSYYKFIVRQGPVDEVILQATRDLNRGKKINHAAVKEYVLNGGGEAAWNECKNWLASETPSLVPCRAFHPYTPYTSLHTLYALFNSGKLIFPVYLSLALVPAVVLRFKNFVNEPLQVLIRSVLSAAQSTLFLALFPTAYFSLVMAQRKFIQHFKRHDHKLVYYIAGFFASLTILIERKSRRSELALYAFPRAMDSLYMIMYHHKLAFRVPKGEIVLFCSAMSAVMWFYDNEKACLSPLISKLLERFLPKPKLRFLGDSANDAIGARQNEIKGNGLRNEVNSSGDDADVSEGDTPTPKHNEMERNKSMVSLNGGYTILP
mmetsp:Transcript_8274/g.13396  ORF Transcript_8274/g.13396 Transcript_8274/m.13396 type:complete len:524 (-) Transcript_8274:1950-3521(-)|eukprot:CAMPEP_0203763024 /NCGR_PEP_ID=MMETSP0098-20131031/15750_1 /ASSEMBLY_ACC=CAM_ASM_000208 /TAXON_ID=96639 /ORGANISM=" , Strain NY0313808BC1" /LENGTH=523 /DNA_ID=CAMNT_0050657627 /DNA_START=186 /DNA_END=1757 /DNA_ORIENTATION=-